MPDSQTNRLGYFPVCQISTVPHRQLGFLFVVVVHAELHMLTLLAAAIESLYIHTMAAASILICSGA